ncbi:MAG: Glutamine synthetase [Phycisphaerae bacterium]|nr:Glutamine synthetase [Phycisphaerae bacterium]
MTPKQVLELCKKREVKFVDLRFMDFPGLWQHTTCPVEELKEDSFVDGFGFDGSSIRGWQAINESDMLIVPVAETAMIDPFMSQTTMSIICDVKDPRTRKEYSRDPRSIARKCAAYLKKTGIGDTAYFGPELEFFIFDTVRYDQTVNAGYYFIDAFEGVWNRGKDEVANKGHKVRLKEGYFPVPPTDSDHELRSEMVTLLQEAAGIRIEAHHHEVATGGQAEIDMRFQELVRMADSVMVYKYILKNCAARHGKTVTFMPKPLFQDNGSGMHVHTSIWKEGKNTFAGTEYAGLSQQALWAIGGILKHSSSLLAFTNPTTNSYKRLVPGYEAPVNMVYSSSNRSAAIRIPMYSDRPESRRLEFRAPDSSCNPYLAFSAITMAMIDGIQNKLEPGTPVDKNLYDLEPSELATIPTAPASLEKALECLEADHQYLLAGDVFTPDVIHYWIRYKMDNEVDAIRMRPHPFEFCMYFDL